MVGVGAGDWPQFGGDLQATAASDDLSPHVLPSAMVAASAPLGVKDASGVVVLADRVYAYAAGSPAGRLHCLDATTLTTCWSAPVSVNDDGFGSWATPCVSTAGVVFAADDFLGCWSLDGTPRWTTTLPLQTVNSSPVIAGDRVIVGMFSYMNNAGAVGAFSLATGSQLWHTVTLTGAVFSIFSSCTPVIDADSGKGYACCNDLVWQFDVATGATGWVTRIPGMALNNLSLASNRLFVVNYDAYAATEPGSNLFALGAADGTLLWVGICGMSDVAPALANGIAVHACGDSAITPMLTAFDSVTGAQLWQQTNVGNYAAKPAISRDVVYAAAALYSGWTFDGYTNLCAIALTNGALISATGTAHGGASPAIANATLYSANQGVVYAYTVPEPGALGMLGIVLLTALGRRRQQWATAIAHHG